MHDNVSKHKKLYLINSAAHSAKEKPIVSNTVIKNLSEGNVITLPGKEQFRSNVMVEC